ncbi:MAG: (2Fe-2S) ferredoxin domain-containing protein [Bacillota bacterium]
MISIEVCVGSSCHLKGSYEIVGAFDQLISDAQLGDQVELRGIFCLEHCTQGVTVRVRDQIYSIKTKQEAIDLLRGAILSEVGRETSGDHHYQSSQL